MQKNKLFYLVLYFILFALSFHRAITVLDPDFGWHIKAGELIASGQFSRSDPFSYTMPSYQFIDHEWLTNLIMYKVFIFVGPFGLALIFSLLFMATLFILIGGNKNTASKPLLLMLLFVSLFPYYGIRPQVLSWLFAALFLRILVFNNKVKRLLIIPVLQIIWTNLHGSFPLGLIILIGVLARDFFIFKKINYRVGITLLLSSLATLINPYGIGAWKEVYMQLTDSKLSSNVSEWIPSVYTAAPVHLLVLVLVLVFGYLNWQKVKQKKYFFLLIFFFFVGAKNTRNIPLWSILSIPVLADLLTYFKNSLSTQSAKNRYKKAFGALLLITFVLSSLETAVDIKKARKFQEESFYPQKAIAFLKNQEISNQIFSTYGWGGYLIWKYPEKKVFIDGRMPSWRRKGAPENESVYAMEEFNKVVYNETAYKNVFEKYSISYVLWPKAKEDPDSPLIQKMAKVLKISKYDFLFIKDLENSNWKKIYEDEVAIIYKDPTI